MVKIRRNGKEVGLGSFILLSAFCGFSGFAMFMVALVNFLIIKAFCRKDSDARKDLLGHSLREMKKNLLPFLEVVLIMLPFMLFSELFLFPAFLLPLKMFMPLICLSVMFFMCVAVRLLGFRDLDCCKEDIDYKKSVSYDKFVVLIDYKVEDDNLESDKRKEDNVPVCSGISRFFIKLCQIVAIPIFLFASVIQFFEAAAFFLLHKLCALVKSDEKDEALGRSKMLLRKSAFLVCVPFYVPSSLSKLSEGKDDCCDSSFRFERRNTVCAGGVEASVHTRSSAQWGDGGGRSTSQVDRTVISSEGSAKERVDTDTTWKRGDNAIISESRVYEVNPVEDSIRETLRPQIS